MRLPEMWPLYAKWFVVWLVVGAVFGLCVPLVDRVFFFLCHRGK